MIKRRILELLLDTLRVPRHGRDSPGETRHMLRVSLVWPRMAIAQKISAGVIVMRDGVYRPDAGSWTERALFKESVEGPFGIRAEVSEALSESQWADALSRLGNAVWTMAGTQIGDIADNPLTTLLWRTPFDALSRTAAAATRNEPRLIASGAMDMQCDAWIALEEKRLDLSMRAPADVSRISRRRVGGKLQSRRTAIVQRDEPNGNIEFLARVYR